MSTIPPQPTWDEPLDYDDDTQYDRYIDWANNVWAPWVEQYGDAWEAANGTADPVAEGHEDTGVCSDEILQPNPGHNNDQSHFIDHPTHF